MLLIMQFTRFPVTIVLAQVHMHVMPHFRMGYVQKPRFVRRIVKSKHNVTCMPNARQRFGKHKQMRATGNPLLSNGSVNTPP
jgi:hypothetical protein